MKFRFALLTLLGFGVCHLKGNAQTCGSDTVTLSQKWEYGTGLNLPIHIATNPLNHSYIYVAAKSGGLIILDVSQPNQASLVATIPVSSFNNLEVLYCEQYSDFLYVALGNYFGTNIQKAGMAIVDVTDPTDPVVTDAWEDDVLEKGSAILKVQDDYAYLGAMTDGLIILDISDKNNIQFVSKFIPDPNWPVENPIPSMTPNARGMQVIGDIIYLCYDAGGLRIINVHDKLNPKETGRYINQGVLSKQQAYNTIAVYDNLAYIGVDYCGMEIVDISDTSNITQVGWWNPWDCTSPTNLWVGCHGHGNEVTYDDQQKIIFMSAGASDLRIIDVSNPSNPDSCGGFGTYTDTLAAYGMTVDGDKIYLSYIFALIPYFSVWAGVKEVEWNSSYNSIDEIQPDENFSISPNLFTDKIQIQFHSENSGKAIIEVSDLQGRILEKKNDIVVNSGNNYFELSLSQLPTAFYIVKFYFDGTVITRKILRQL